MLMFLEPTHSARQTRQASAMAWCVSSDHQPSICTFGTNAKPEEGTQGG